MPLVQGQHFLSLVRESSMEAVDVSFVEYLELTAAQGVELKRSGRSSGLPLKDNAYWGLFGLEYAIAMGAAGLVSMRRAQEPFCELCKRWYGAEQLIGMADGDKKVMRETLALIERGEILRANELAGAPSNKAALVLAARFCDQCQESEPLLIAKRVVNPSSSKPQVKVVLESLITREELKQLQSAYAGATTGE